MQRGRFWFNEVADKAGWGQVLMASTTDLGSMTIL